MLELLEDGDWPLLVLGELLVVPDLGLVLVDLVEGVEVAEIPGALTV